MWKLTGYCSTRLMSIIWQLKVKRAIKHCILSTRPIRLLITKPNHYCITEDTWKKTRAQSKIVARLSTPHKIQSNVKYSLNFQGHDVVFQGWIGIRFVRLNGILSSTTFKKYNDGFHLVMVDSASIFYFVAKSISYGCAKTSSINT